MEHNGDLSYEPHRYAELFPLDGGPSLDKMADQMEEDGFDERYKIVLYEGKVLDGRRRQLAARRAGVTPLYEEFDGDDEAALRFVMRANIHRRHLDTAEAAMIAAQIADMTREQTLKKGRDFSDARKKASEKPPGVSQAKAAAMMGVSRTSAQNAKAILESGAADLIDAVKKKKVSLSAAAKVARELKKAVHEAMPPKKGKKGGSKKKEQLLPYPDDDKIDRLLEETAAALEARQQAFGNTPELKAIIDDLDALTARWHQFAGKPAPEQEIVPDELDTPEFRKVWEEWKQYKKEIKKRLSPTTRRRQLKELAEWGLEAAIKAIETSITKGWHGLFEPDGNTKATHDAKNAEAQDAWLERTAQRRQEQGIQA